MIDVNTVFMNVYYFIMGDVYNFIEKYINLFVYYLSYYRYYRQPILLKYVHVKYNENMTDVTKHYIYDSKWTEGLDDDTLIYVTWTYLDNEYKYVYKLSQPIEFPPYSLEQLRKKNNTKIIAINVDPHETDENIIEIKKYAGPFHNFYSDISNNQMKLKWILHKDVNTINVINNKGKIQTLDINHLKID